ncbi:MAG: M28 family peptidase [Ignavibacteriales bacterium]
MRISALCLSLLIILFISSCSNPNDPLHNSPRAILDPSAISIDSLTRTVAELSGERSTVIYGRKVTILSRNMKFEGNSDAADYLEEKLKRLGLQVINQRYSATGRNILAIQEGENKENYFVICAHYDSYPENILSPGADDNASGTAVVLEAARVISKLKPQYSVLYAFWDEEEGGTKLHGSAYFADSASRAQMKIKLVLNMDMLGYDGDNDGLTVLFQPAEYGAGQYADIIHDVNEKHGFGVKFWQRLKAAPSDDVFFYDKKFCTLAFGEKLQPLP